MSDTIRRVLVAARGAAAVRLAGSVVDAGFEVVVLMGIHDEGAAWLSCASYAVPVPDGPHGWPDRGHVLAAALDAGCDAILPGWDALARDVGFAQACRRNGLAWLGCPLMLLSLAEDRMQVRSSAEELDLPVVPGTDPVDDLALALAWATHVGFPVAVKRAEGASRPLVRADSAEELTVVVEGLLSEGAVVIERYVLDAREIEVPIAGDGEEVVVALGTRELTGRMGGLRRVATAPAALPEDVASEMEDMALELAASIGWQGVGAVQFLLTPDLRPYLLDLRPGLRPHDVVTERVYGVDLVDAAVRTGLEQVLLWEPETVEPDGFGIALRLTASTEVVEGSDPSHPGQRVVGALQLPPEAAVVVRQGEQVRSGDELGHVLVHGSSRHPVLVRAKVITDELDVGGVPCALPGIRRLLGDRDWWEGQLGREAAAQVAGVDPEH